MLSLVSYMVLYQFHSNSEDYLLLVFASWVLAIYAGLILHNRYKKKELLSPIAIYALLMLVHFALPGMVLPFYEVFYSNSLNLQYSGPAQLFVLMSFFFFHIGYQLFAHQPKEQEKYELNTPNAKAWKDRRVAFVLVLLITVGWVTRFYVIESFAYSQLTRQSSDLFGGGLHSIIRILELFPRYALIIVCIHHWLKIKKNESFKWKWVVISLVLSELIYWFPAGRKTEIILTLIFPLSASYLVLKVLPSRRVLISLGVAVLMLFPIMYFYRTAMDIEGLSELNSIDDIFAAAKSAPELGIEHRKGSFEILLGRISLLEPVSGSIRIVQIKKWDLFLGKTYSWAIAGLIPGVLWKDKPNFSLGTKFGHASGILDYSNKFTAISVTFIGEAFLNFAWFGIGVWFVFGLIYSKIYMVINRGANNAVLLLMYLLLLPNILYIGGTFTLYFSGLLKLLIIFYFIGIFMLNKKQKCYYIQFTQKDKPAMI